jgi:hypothetical protein
MSAAPTLARILALASILAGALSGCAGLGQSDFACPGYPSRPLCLSTSEVYWLTDGDALPQATVRPRPIPEAPRLEDPLFLEAS